MIRNDVSWGCFIIVGRPLNCGFAFSQTGARGGSAIDLAFRTTTKAHQIILGRDHTAWYSVGSHRGYRVFFKRHAEHRAEQPTDHTGKSPEVTPQGAAPRLGVWCLLHSGWWAHLDIKNPKIIFGKNKVGTP